MKCYIDTSVLLRVVLGEPRSLKQWRQLETPISSELVRLEALRTIDRARVRMKLPDREIAKRRADALELIESFYLAPINQSVLLRAAEPFPPTLGTLDAIHLATALLVRSAHEDLALATHDRELATAARAVGFRVLGAPGA